MEEKRKRWVGVGLTIMVMLTVGVLFSSYAPASAADRDQAQILVDRAQITLKDFMRDPNYRWLRENINRAYGVVIFPQILKGGFIWGASGGTGVLLVRDEKTGDWSEPAFYSIGSVTFGLQIGGEASEVIMLAMTRKAIDSLLLSSFKLGGDASISIGPAGAGAKASADIPRVTADFVSLAKSKGLYAGMNLEGAFVAVRGSLNKAYYGKELSPVDILVKKAASNEGAERLQETLKKAT
jgi:lipid-binding SYLF domain-containing protein